MIKSKILVILKEGEFIEPYLEYIKEMQNLFKKGVIFLVIEKEKRWKLFESYLVATAFSEEGFPEYALEEIKKLSHTTKTYLAQIQKFINEKNLEQVEILITNKNLINEVKSIIEKEYKVELLIVSPEANKYLFRRKKMIKELVQEIKVPLITFSPKTS